MISQTRALIWSLSKGDTTLIEKAKKGVKLQDPELYWTAVLRNVEQACKPRRVRKTPTDQTTQASKDRYRQAKWDYESSKFKPWVQDGHFIEPEYPNCSTSNGLQEFILYYCKWMGWRATRINVMGRKIGDTWIPSSTRKGSADVSCTINGRSVMLEVKVGRDTPSDKQLAEQQRERNAGGIYEFIHSAEEFLALVDRIPGKELFS